MKDSKIEWTDHTFNPWWGCTKVPGHPGCAHCYAEAFSKRTGRAKWGKGEKRVIMSRDYWNQPLQWDRCAAAAGKRARVFCASMADVFDAEVPDMYREALFETICETRNLDWLLLTKRPDQAKRFYDEYIFKHSDGRVMPAYLRGSHAKKLLPNVWLGVSVSDQETADKYIPELLKVPAVCHFISYEPAVGPVNFYRATNTIVSTEKIGIDWIIVGGESGPKSRPFHTEWARSTVQQCAAARVACFVKQLGAKPLITRPDGDDAATLMDFPLKLKDAKGGDMSEWPGMLEDLRVRAFPTLHA